MNGERVLPLWWWVKVLVPEDQILFLEAVASTIMTGKR